MAMVHRDVSCGYGLQFCEGSDKSPLKSTKMLSWLMVRNPVMHGLWTLTAHTTWLLPLPKVSWQSIKDLWKGTVSSIRTGQREGTYFGRAEASG